MARLRVSAAARRDIKKALRLSEQRWGPAQRQTYRALIEEALLDLLENPEQPASRPRDEIRSGVRTFHIARRGRPGRHFVVYPLGPDGTFEVMRLLHDALDLSRAFSPGP
jgi:toxin ParE1/3/4